MTLTAEILLCFQLELLLIAVGIYILLGKISMQGYESGQKSENDGDFEVVIRWRTLEAAYTLFAGLWYIGKISKGEIPQDVDLWLNNARKIRKFLTDAKIEEDSQLIVAIDDCTEKLIRQVTDSDE